MEMEPRAYLVVFSIFGYVCSLAGVNGGECSFIFESARIDCGHPGIHETGCADLGCCWDDGARDPMLRCYKKSCRPGYFGWGCRFRCNCKSSKDICDPRTGECSQGCSTKFWGVGCMLDIDCSYNDPVGKHYMGRRARTKSGRICASWGLQYSYPNDQFPDKSKRDAKNSCRNPSPPDNSTWCYYSHRPTKLWEFCDIQPCDCPVGRYGVNCEDECHCKDPYEVCHPLNGTCNSGCDLRYKPPHCRECAEGRYGLNCNYKCNCRSARERCDLIDGTCTSGCAAGFSGPGCQIQCRCRDPDEVCNPKDGSCISGCMHGWTGKSCNIDLPRLKMAPKMFGKDAHSISLSWQNWSRQHDGGSGPVKSYILSYREATDDSWTTTEPTSSNTATITALKEGTMYVMRVTPIHQQDYVGFPSPSINISTCGRPLSGPVDMVFEALGGSHIDDFDKMHEGTTLDSLIGDIHVPDLKVRLDLRWKAPRQEYWNCNRLQKFKIYTLPAGSSRFEFWRDLEISRVVIGDVSIFSNYSAGVTAINSANFESDMTIATFIGRSSQVQNLDVTSPTPHTLHITWSTPSMANARIDRFVLRHKEIRIADCEVEHSVWSEKFLLSGLEREFMLRDLKPYSHYQIRLWAETQAGKGVVAMTHGTTRAKAPEIEVTGVKIYTVNEDSAVLSWQPVACEDRYGMTQGYLYEIVDQTGVIASTQLLNATSVTVRGLTPYQRYRFMVKYVNHVGGGPYEAELTFRTLQGRPPAPENFEIHSSASTSLNISWTAPYPAHGILTGYEMKYWSSSNQASPDIVRVPPEQTKLNLDNLRTTTGYGMQVRAYTTAGSGVWSPPIYGYTEEARPDAPRSFRNVSRSSDTISVIWEKPRKENGFLKSYKLSCMPMTEPEPESVRDLEVELSPSTLNFTLQNLSPATAYVCSLKASTSVGFGQTVKRKFWTQPKVPMRLPSPVIDLEQITSNTITIHLDAPNSRSRQHSDNDNRVYRVVVEMLEDSAIKTRRSASSDATPCDIPPSELMSYSDAKERGFRCYIAAEFPSLSSGVFVVGDNKTYGHYYNAPLEEGRDYNIWFGLSQAADGVTVGSYSKSPVQSTVQLSGADDDETATAATAMVAGIAVAALLALVLLLIIIFIIISRRRKSKKETKELILPPKTITPDNSTPDKPVRPPRKKKKVPTATLR